MQKILEKAIIVLIILIWTSHLVQVFTPEVGFDAVWYHLPVIKTVIEQHRLVFIPHLYQSLNPLLSDLIFGIGFFFAQEQGAKIIAYMFGLVFIVVSYILSKNFLDRFWALVVVLIISTFQVVAWQSASFYVDVAKAYWELSAVLFLVKWHTQQQQKWLLVSALFLGASLATKLFSIFLLPVFLYLVFIWSKQHQFINLIKFLISSLVLPLPFYVFTYLKTGQPFFSFSLHLAKLAEIGNHSSLAIYVWDKTKLLYVLPAKLIFARDYTSFLLILLMPILLMFVQKIKNNQILLGITIFTIWQILCWWYLPPLSTRYALSGFVTWTMVSIWSVAQFSSHARRFYWPLLVTIFLAVGINLAPRIAVNVRSFRYLLTTQSEENYIRQFFDGNIDQHLISWYGLD